MRHEVDCARADGMVCMHLEVRASNAPAIEALRKLGVRAGGAPEGLLPGRRAREDAVLMCLEITKNGGEDRAMTDDMKEAFTEPFPEPFGEEAKGWKPYWDQLGLGPLWVRRNVPDPFADDVPGFEASRRCGTPWRRGRCGLRPPAARPFRRSPPVRSAWAASARGRARIRPHGAPAAPGPARGSPAPYRPSRRRDARAGRSVRSTGSARGREARPRDRGGNPDRGLEASLRTRERLPRVPDGGLAPARRLLGRRTGAQTGRRGRSPGERRTSGEALRGEERSAFDRDARRHRRLAGREDAVILNTLKCRPPQNRDPLPDELQACEAFLRRQLEILAPDVVFVIGRFAAKSMLPEMGTRPWAACAGGARDDRRREEGSRRGELPPVVPSQVARRQGEGLGDLVLLRRTCREAGWPSGPSAPGEGGGGAPSARRTGEEDMDRSDQKRMQDEAWNDAWDRRYVPRTARPGRR